jgi:hypothetical protein
LGFAGILTEALFAFFSSISVPGKMAAKLGKWTPSAKKFFLLKNITIDERKKFL